MGEKELPGDEEWPPIGHPKTSNRAHSRPAAAPTSTDPTKVPDDSPKYTVGLMIYRVR
jgi:hypothetical protein